MNENKIVIIGIISILVAIIGIYLRWSKKNLSYYIESAYPVVSVEKRVADRVKISFDDHFVEDVHLIILDIRNSGNQSIQKSDFDVPPFIYFGDNTEILSASITETDPANLKPTFIYQEDGIIIEPLLLNANDFIRFNFLVSKCNYEDINITGRIIGIKEIKKEHERSRNFTIFILLGALTSISGILLAGFEFITIDQFIYVYILSYFFIFLGFLVDRRTRKRFLEAIKSSLRK